MKNTALAIGLLSLCTLLTSCDAFRRMAGKPTSAQIESMQEAIDRYYADKKQHREDSLRKVLRAREDSIRRADSLREAEAASAAQAKKSGIPVLLPSVLGGIRGELPAKRYCIVIGSFKNRDYALARQALVQSRGYEAILIDVGGALTAVGVCPSESLEDQKAAYRAVKAEPFCPPDAWILDCKPN